MNKIFSLYSILFLFVAFVSAQQNKIYNPSASAIIDIDSATEKAFAENKFVLVKAGGNQCKWFIKFKRFCKPDIKIDSLIKSSYPIPFKLQQRKFE